MINRYSFRKFVFLTAFPWQPVIVKCICMYVSISGFSSELLNYSYTHMRLMQLPLGVLNLP